LDRRQLGSEDEQKALQEGGGEVLATANETEGVAALTKREAAELRAVVDELSSTVSQLSEKVQALEEQLRQVGTGSTVQVAKEKQLREERPSDSLWEAIRARALADRPRKSYVWTTPIVKPSPEREIPNPIPQERTSTLPNLPSRAERYGKKK
jgi:outer membrane murein-binding lipoprotein Lpp